MWELQVRRRRVAKLRREKQELNIWSLRWLTACNRFWKRFAAMPVCEKSLLWAERKSSLTGAVSGQPNEIKPN